MAAKAQPTAQVADLGAWKGDSAQLATAQRSSFGDVDDLPAELRFQVYVSRMIRKREARAGTETSGAAAFILCTSEQQEEFAQGRSLDRNAHTGRVQLAARLHFVTPRAATSVFEEYAGDDTGLFKRIKDLQCDRLPALIYLPSTDGSTLTYYPHGTHTDDGILDVQVNYGPVTEAEVLAVIDAVYRTALCTPDNSGTTKFWKDAGNGHPVKEAERTVQDLLRAGLAGRFNWCSIRSEQAGKVGRTDLEIIDDRTGDAGSSTHHALLELKVLRSFSHMGAAYPASGATEAVTKGLEQANSYGNDKNSLLRMLCCFDMRTDDPGDAATFAHVKVNAETLCVSLKRWYMYRSSEHLRKAEAQRQLAAANDATAPASKRTSSGKATS